MYIYIYIYVCISLKDTPQPSHQAQTQSLANTNLESKNPCTKTILENINLLQVLDGNRSAKGNYIFPGYSLDVLIRYLRCRERRKM